MKTYIHNLWQPINNVRLIAFRICFGFVMFYECVGSIMNGWVKDKYVDTHFNFAFIGFEWLNILHGSFMYVYYFVMAFMAFCIALGLCYRFSSVLFAILWSLIYLSDKSHYNNHFYLMVLLSWIMVFVPANKRFSLDVKYNLTAASNFCFTWQIHVFIFQVAIVYFFAAIAKMNSDWFHAIPVTTWLFQRTGLPIIGHYLRNPIMPWFIAYGGFIFDLLFIPALLYRPTRLFAFFVAIFFHFFNSYVFKIGTFPFLALSLNIFFFSDRIFEKLLSKNSLQQTAIGVKNNSNKIANGLLAVYFLSQVLLPVRHWFIPGNVNWTEEGHRHSWRMMVRSKIGTSVFKIVNKKNDSTWYLPASTFFDSSHLTEIAVLPDFTWQAANHVNDLYKNKYPQIAIYSINTVRLNYRPAKMFIDTTIDLASTKWNYFGHNKWILPE